MPNTRRFSRGLSLRSAATPPQGLQEPPSITIATWNVNSVNVRLPALLEYLQRRRPDVLALQEIKCEDAAFPRAEIEAQGYYTVFSGQKSYNGVAILSRSPLGDVAVGLPGGDEDPDDAQARYIEATTCGGLRVGCLYLPNGEPVDSDKFAYRQRWAARLSARAGALLRDQGPAVLLGDYNVCPADADCFDAAQLAATAALHPASRAAYRELIYKGYTNALKAAAAPGSEAAAAAAAQPSAGARPGPGPRGVFSYWGYQGGGWERGEGMLIDHILLSPVASDHLLAAGVDWQLRAGPRPSDHVPVWARIAV